jgi:hypothetical protein
LLLCARRATLFTKPANNTALSSAEVRAQLQALNADIQSRATAAALSGAIDGTSSNSNGVATLDNGYGDPEAEELRNKLNELINALRR